jgi:hypothetical protein
MEEPAMKLRPSVASVISEHVAFERESIDRMYLSCRYRRERYNAEFRITPSDLRIPLVGSLLVKTHSA